MSDKKFAKNINDTGSTAVQIMNISNKIRTLSSHSKENKKDYSSLRGLNKKVSQMRALMKYLKRKNAELYQDVMAEMKNKK